MIIFWSIVLIFAIPQQILADPLPQNERNLHFSDRRREAEDTEFRTRRPINGGGGSNIENIFKIPIAVIKGTSAAAQAFYPQNTETINKIFDIPVMTLDAVGNYIKERPQRPGLNVQDGNVEQNPIRFGGQNVNRRRDERRERINQLREQERLERERRRMIINQERLERDRRRLMDRENQENDRRRLIDQENQEKNRRRLMDRENQENERRRLIDQENQEKNRRRLMDRENQENERRRLMDREKLENDQSSEQQRFFLGGGHHSIGLYDVASAFADLLVGGGHGHHHGHGQIFARPPKRPLKPIKPLKPHKPHKPGHLSGLHGGLLGGNGIHGGHGGHGGGNSGYEVHEQFHDTPFQSSAGSGVFSWLQTTFQSDPLIGHPKIQNKIAPGSEFRNNRENVEFRDF